MQPLTFTLNNLAQQRTPSDEWLFWMIVLWIITADDDKKRERKRRLARQQREDGEQRARRKALPHQSRQHPDGWAAYGIYLSLLIKRS